MNLLRNSLFGTILVQFLGIFVRIQKELNKKKFTPIKRIIFEKILQSLWTVIF